MSTRKRPLILILRKRPPSRDEILFKRRKIAQDNDVTPENLPAELMVALAQKADANTVKKLMLASRAHASFLKHSEVWWPIYVRKYGVFGLRAFNVRNPDGTVDEEGSKELETYYMELGEHNAKALVLQHSARWTALERILKGAVMDARMKLKIVLEEDGDVTLAQENLTAAGNRQKEQENLLKRSRLWYWAYQYREKLGAGFRWETVGGEPGEVLSQELKVDLMFRGVLSPGGEYAVSARPGYGHRFTLSWSEDGSIYLSVSISQSEDLKMGEKEIAWNAVGLTEWPMIPLRRGRMLIPTGDYRFSLYSWEHGPGRVVYRDESLHGQPITTEWLDISVQDPDRVAGRTSLYDPENDTMAITSNNTELGPWILVFDPSSLRILWSSVESTLPQNARLRAGALSNRSRMYLFFRGELIYVAPRVEPGGAGLKITAWKVWRPGMSAVEPSPALQEGPFVDRIFGWPIPVAPPPETGAEFRFSFPDDYGKNPTADGGRILLFPMARDSGELAGILMKNLADLDAAPVAVVAPIQEWTPRILGPPRKTNLNLAGGVLFMTAKKGEMWIADADADAFRATPGDPHVWRRRFLLTSFRGNPMPDVKGPFSRLKGEEVFLRYAKDIRITTGIDTEVTIADMIDATLGLELDGSRLTPSVWLIYHGSSDVADESMLISGYFVAVNEKGDLEETQILVGDSVELKRGRTHVVALHDAGEEPFYVGTSQTGGFGRPGEWGGAEVWDGKLVLRTDGRTPSVLYYRSALRDGIGGSISIR